VTDSKDDARKKPYINVRHCDIFDRVTPGTAQAQKWLEANVPDDDEFLEVDYELEGFVLSNSEALIEKAEAAEITVYHWDESGFELDSAGVFFEEEAEEEPDDEEVTSEQPGSGKPAAQPAPAEQPAYAPSPYGLRHTIDDEGVIHVEDASGAWTHDPRTGEVDIVAMGSTVARSLETRCPPGSTLDHQSE
jgi:hypothetical protein